MKPEAAMLCGQWSGNNMLRLSWLPDPEQHSSARAEITPEANAKFFTMRYRWRYEEVDHEGVLLFGLGDDSNPATAAWCDSWHMSGRLMMCSGGIDTAGAVAFTGSYQAPPGPDWGWRIELSLPVPDSLCMRMFNIEPNGNEELAVQADFVRVR